MSKDILADHRKALEESFFAQENERLRQQLRKKQQEQAAREALSEASGIRDQAVLDHLVQAGITAETMTALSLVPLVEVAWADHTLDARERDAITDAARKSGVREGTPAHDLLAGWLTEAPGPELREAWETYARALAKTLPPDLATKLRDEIVGRARAVAESAGGFLGLATVSDEESAVLESLEKAFG